MEKRQGTRESTCRQNRPGRPARARRRNILRRNSNASNSAEGKGKTRKNCKPLTGHGPWLSQRCTPQSFGWKLDPQDSSPISFNTCLAVTCPHRGPRGSHRAQRTAARSAAAENCEQKSIPKWKNVPHLTLGQRKPGVF